LIYQQHTAATESRLIALRANPNGGNFINERSRTAYSQKSLYSNKETCYVYPHLKIAFTSTFYKDKTYYE
tara:strand:- start:224 stop:433 length:210 start_codon:yes stop_codon:yes gene_type:complete